MAKRLDGLHRETCTALAMVDLDNRPLQGIALSASFVFNVSSGTFVGAEGSGTVLWKPDYVAGSGLEVLKLGAGFIALNLSFLGNTYLASSAIGFPDCPRLIFSNGLFCGLDYAFQVHNSSELIRFDPLSDAVTDAAIAGLSRGTTRSPFPLLQCHLTQRV